ncbi:MAG: hypothetical protein Fur0026_04350 [Sideroxydans sp.]
MAADLRKLVFLLGALCGAGAIADDLPDPTRPAVELMPSLENGATVTPPPAPAGLQSVILSGKREAAIINGTEVEVGQKYGEATLTVVNETCVVLMGAQGRQVMHLYPTVHLSKTQLACTGRNGLPVIRKAARSVPGSAAQKTKRKKIKPATRKATTCGCDESKNGSVK